MFTIYATHDCVWCKKAQELLKNNNQKFSVLYIDMQPIFLEQYKQKFPGKKTVPQIETYFNDNGDRTTTYIGGYDDLVRYFR